LVDELGGFEAAVSAARLMLGGRASTLRPALLSPPRSPVPPLDVPRQKAAELITSVAAFGQPPAAHPFDYVMFVHH
jgi:hypothetical protein